MKKPNNIVEEIERVYKEESSRVLASLIRIFNNFDLGEELLQEAFYVAMNKWVEEGIPKNPYSWLVSVGKYKGIDRLRREKKGNEIKLNQLILKQNHADDAEQQAVEKSQIDDDQLRLIFYCCHPAIPLDSQMALSLKEVCGLTSKDIAKAFLSTYETIKKRITRAKSIFRENNVSFEIPQKEDLKIRLDRVLQVIYLIYNEGYSASFSNCKSKTDLTNEAIILSRKLVNLYPSSECYGLLSLILIQESRKVTRFSVKGDIVQLEDQDRSLWNKELISEGLFLLQKSILSGRLGSYGLQAAIASVYAVSTDFKSTQWPLIIDYYDKLLSINPSPVIKLNQCVAIGMLHGPAQALGILNRLEKDKSLKGYNVIYSIKAHFLNKLNLDSEAILYYKKAIQLTEVESEKKYLKQQLKNISN